MSYNPNVLNSGGGTASGAIEVNVPARASSASSLGVHSLKLGSTFDGGENAADSTGRLELESYQRAQHTSDNGQYAHYGEVIRIRSRRWDSKQMIAWYGPTAWNGDGTPATADSAWFWMGAHYEANDHASVHGHWSVEVPDTAGNLQTRMEFRIWDPVAGTFGMDKTLGKVNATDFVIDQSNGSFQLAAAAGTAKNAYFTNSSLADPTGKRWGLQADTTAEAGANVGTDFRINRYNDSGAFVESSFFIRRSTGQVGIGGITNPAAKLDVTAAGSYPTVQATQTSTSSVVYAAIAAVLGTTANKYLEGRIAGDATARVAIYGDGRHEWGDGTNARDTVLRRASAGTLATDGTFSVGGALSASGAVTLNSTLAVTGATTLGSTLAVAGTATINGQPVGQHLFAKKTANEIVNNSATVQDDDHMTVAVAASSVYEVAGFFIYDGTSTADMKLGFAGPAGATLDWVTASLDATAGSATTAVKMSAQTISGTPSFGSVGAGSKVVARVTGLLTTSTTAGTFKVQWAQNTAEATDTTMYSGSYLRLTKIT